MAFAEGTTIMNRLWSRMTDLFAPTHRMRSMHHHMRFMHDWPNLRFTNPCASKSLEMLGFGRLRAEFLPQG